MKRIVILGSTGSIGKSTLSVARHLGLEVVGLAAHSNLELLEEQIAAFNPKAVALFDHQSAHALSKKVELPVHAGLEGLCQLAQMEGVDLVVCAITGAIGIEPTLAAIDAGREIALANKEVLVAAGELVMRRAREKGVPILPVDSEHSALFQCLVGEKDVQRLILTASGGPFLHTSVEGITPEMALKHPTWKMGQRVTIDSSTLMNKGFEVIEAHHLFDMPVEKIDVVVHPQSLIHSLVEFEDGSLKAQISNNDMRLPIQYAITYPKRVEGVVERFSFKEPLSMQFYPPDFDKFRCLALAYEALKMGGTAPCFLNAADEVLVERFLKKEISWNAIGKKLETLLGRYSCQKSDHLETILETDRHAREMALRV